MVVAGGILTGFGGVGLATGIAFWALGDEAVYIGIPTTIASVLPIAVGVPLLIVGGLHVPSGRRTTDASGRPLPMGHRDEGMVIAGATLTAIGGAGLVAGAITMAASPAVNHGEGLLSVGAFTAIAAAPVVIVGVPILAVGAGRVPVEVVVTGPTQVGVRGSF